MGLPWIFRLNSLKLGSSASISFSIVSHNVGFQRGTASVSGECRMSSPTDQNFGGGSLDMLSRCETGLVTADGDMCLRMICLFIGLKPRAGRSRATLIIAAGVKIRLHTAARRILSATLITSRAYTMSNAAGPSRVNVEGVMLFEQPFARVSGPFLVHSGTLIHSCDDRFRLRTTGRSFVQPNDK